MTGWINAGPVLLAAATLVPAVITDIRERKIPNTLCLLSLISALALHWLLGGSSAAFMALCGALLLLAITLPLFAKGWLGAGDVKLITAMGAVAGEPSIALGMLASITVAGGLLALFIHYRHRPREAIPPPTPSGASASKRISINKPAITANTPQALPYGVAIAIGSLAVLLARMQGVG